jgi:hypothetical protein
MVSSVLIVISNIVIALATVGLVYAGFSNLRLAGSIRDRSEQHEQEMKNLLHAVVVALMSAPHGGESFQSAVNKFKKNYRGNTPIFE